MLNTDDDLRATGMEISMPRYDGGSALAEAAMMAIRITALTILVSNAIHPNYRAVLRTYLSGAVNR